MSLTLAPAVSVRERTSTTTEITDRDGCAHRKIDAEVETQLVWLTGHVESDDGETIGRHETLCMSHAAAEALAHFLLRAVAAHKARRAA